MHNRILPSFFFANSTGALHCDEFGLIYPCSNNSYNSTFSSANSFDIILYRARDTGLAPGTNYIMKLVSFEGVLLEARQETHPQTPPPLAHH